MPQPQTTAPGAVAARHPTRIDIVAQPAEPPRAGATFEIAITIACPNGCKLGPAIVSVSDPAGDMRDFAPTDPGQRCARLTLTAPASAGSHAWTITATPRDAGTLMHDAASATLTLGVVPHVASLAVWELPDAVAAGRPFALNVGASSTAGFILAGRTIEIRDASGAVAARSTLGHDPWPGTAALAWTALELTAPATPSVASWTAGLLTDGLALPHDCIGFPFTVPVTAPAAHRVEVAAVDAATRAPLADAVIRLGAYRATTDAAGRATLEVPAGAFDVVVWKSGFDIPDMAITVAADTTITLEATALTDDDPDGHWRA